MKIYCGKLFRHWLSILIAYFEKGECKINVD